MIYLHTIVYSSKVCVWVCGRVGVNAGKGVWVEGRFWQWHLLTLVVFTFIYVGMKNWALNKNSSQSSTASIANANLAVDGRKGQIFLVYMTKAVCTHTNESVRDRRWWVDLGQTEKVSRVVIYNRAESYGKKNMSGVFHCFCSYSTRSFLSLATLLLGPN